MAKLSYKMYEPDGTPSKLRFVNKGSCTAYVPETRSTRADRPNEPHVTFDFGHTQVMLDLEEFKVFAFQVLNAAPVRNTAKLSLVKGG